MVFKITLLQSFCSNKPNFVVCDIRGAQWQVLEVQKSGQSILLLGVESRCDLSAWFARIQCTQQYRRDADRALLTLLDHLWGFSKFKVLDPHHIYLFTIAMAGTSTAGVTREGVRGTEGVLSIYRHKNLYELCRHTGSLQGLFSLDHTTAFAFCRAYLNTKELSLWKEWASIVK